MFIHKVEQVTDAPTFAMETSEIVCDNRHDIRLSHPSFKRQPARTIIFMHA
ncbi:hypothetical protein QPK87_30035 [Kamptonema cortianum]|nr:hypothetical protein [Kamptonema cortianum]